MNTLKIEGSNFRDCGIAVQTNDNRRLDITNNTVIYTMPLRTIRITPEGWGSLSPQEFQFLQDMADLMIAALGKNVTLGNFDIDGSL